MVTGDFNLGEVCDVRGNGKYFRQYPEGAQRQAGAGGQGGEARSKGYYVAKGLEAILRERLEDLEDYEEARQAYEEFVASGEKGTSFEEVFANVK